VFRSHSYYFNRRGTGPSETVEDPSGKTTLFMKDPFGNIFQLAEASDWFMNEKKATGGAYGAIIGVI